MLATLGVTVSFAGDPPPEGLIISNHLSYLDIMVFSSITHCAFVSKSEVKSWPVIGQVTTRSGAVYIDRGRRSDTHTVRPKMQAVLAHGLRLTMFPEGTSSDGSQVLPFHSSLFQPAVDLNAPITAAAIRYAVPGGDPSVDACYWGDMVLGTHLLNLLQKDSIHATVRFSEQHYRFSDRKEAARTMQQEVERLFCPERREETLPSLRIPHRPVDRGKTPWRT